MMRNQQEDYVLQRVIGQGAYGEVWLVNEVSTNEQFALKKIVMKNMDEGVPQSVVREVATLIGLQRLNHPNIVRLHQAFVKRKGDNICLNIVNEKCDWDLYEFLRAIPKDMCNAQCRHLAKQMFTGIDFLHSNNVIHRDLKPQNILVNKNHSLKIADFGLSRNYGLHATFTTEVVTLWYRSPELLLQCKYNTSVDIWSAGCILVELYNREPLFPAQTESRQIGTIFQKIGTPPHAMWPTEAVVNRSFYPDIQPQPLGQLLPKVNAVAMDLVIQILKFNPHQRPTAAECLQHSYFL